MAARSNRQVFQVCHQHFPWAVDFALAAEEVMAAIRGLHAGTGIDDVFGRMPNEAGD